MNEIIFIIISYLKKYFLIKMSLPRLKIAYKILTSFNQNEMYTKDPLLLLIKDFNDIEYILNNYKAHITKFFYLNKKFISNLLYKLDSSIKFEFEEKNAKYDFYFYLSLLIRDDPFTLDYTFDKKYLLNLIENQDKETVILKKIINAKLIIELSKEYIKIKGLGRNEEGRELNLIIENNKNIIIKNLEKLNLNNELDINWDLDYVIENQIDKLYTELIIGFINKKNFENYDNVYDVFINQICLDKIDITKLMYDELKQYLDCETNSVINEYIIQNDADLNNDLKINFNYFLLKYIFKNIYDIKDIKYIESLRKSIKNIIRANPDMKKNNKIKEIVEIFYIKPIRLIRNNLKKYYREFLLSKKNKEQNNSKNSKKNQSSQDNMQVNIQDDNMDEHGEIKVLDYINSLKIEEFKDEYKKKVLDKIETDDENKIKENLNYIADLMGIEGKQNQKDYRRKFIEIIGNKNFIDKYKKNSENSENSKALTKDILKEVFSFNYNDYSELNDIQKEINKKESLEVNISSLRDCFDKIIK